MAEQSGFRRDVGLSMAVMIGIGAMMGPGVFALPSGARVDRAAWSHGVPGDGASHAVYGPHLQRSRRRDAHSRRRGFPVGRGTIQGVEDRALLGRATSSLIPVAKDVACLAGARLDDRPLDPRPADQALDAPPVERTSTITCSECGQETEVEMPTGGYQFFWKCRACQAVLRAEEGDCCVFCSYGAGALPSGAEAERSVLLGRTVKVR